MTETHTATPWHKGRHPNGRITIENADESRCIAALYGPTEHPATTGAGLPDYMREKHEAARAETGANAALIVRAVNHHQHLVEALERVCSEAETHDFGDDDGRSVRLAYSTYTQARQALKGAQA